jgi:HEAT repeat protein
MQHIVKVNPIPRLNSYDSMDAFSAFLKLGAGGSNAVPGLISLLNQELPQHNKSLIEMILAWQGPSASQAIPTLLKELENTNSNLRGNAAYALGRIHSQSELVTPKLAKATNDPDSYVREKAAGALKEYQTNPK